MYLVVNVMLKNYILCISCFKFKIIFIYKQSITYLIFSGERHNILYIKLLFIIRKL